MCLDELSYDKYNVNADRIYRVNNEIKFGDNYFDLAQCARHDGTNHGSRISAG